jgi:hypothetical protein
MGIPSELPIWMLLMSDANLKELNMGPNDHGEPAPGNTAGISLTFAKVDTWLVNPADNRNWCNCIMAILRRKAPHRGRIHLESVRCASGTMR